MAVAEGNLDANAVITEAPGKVAPQIPKIIEPKFPRAPGAVSGPLPQTFNCNPKPLKSNTCHLFDRCTKVPGACGCRWILELYVDTVGCRALFLFPPILG